MSSQSNTTTHHHVIPIGIDIGSLNARIALSSSSNPADLPSTNQYHQNQHRRYQTPQPGRIVPNASGERFTPAISTIEPEAVADPENDQYWDVPANNNSKKKKKEGEAVPSYIFGEAAKRSLQQEKKDVDERLVRSLLSQEDDEQEEKRNAAQAFVSHLITQATDATHSHPSSLRLVLSIPDAEHTATTHKLVQTTHSAVLTSIRNVGWETSPELTASSSTIRTKRETKALVQKLESLPRISAVITESMAVCHAHNLFRFDEYGPSWSSSDHSQHPPLNYTNVLVMDWGHSSLKLTHLKRLSSTTQTLTPLRTISYPEYGGYKLRTLLAKHVTELFLRQPMVRRSCGRTSLDTVWDNRKARQKLERVCDDALRTLSQSGGAGVAKVAIDGLYEGVDCNVDVTSARFDAASGSWFRSVEALVRTFVTEEIGISNSGVGGVGMDVVLVAGQVASFPPVKGMMDRVCAVVGGGGNGSGGGGKDGRDTTVWRGRGFAEVPPEETVAMGCAMYAAMVTSPFNMELVGKDETNEGQEEEEKEETTDDPWYDHYNNRAVEVDVPLCPVAVGISMQEGDSASIVLIEAGTPLPASIARVVDVRDCVSSGSLGIVQIGRLVNGDETNGNENKCAERLVGRIHGIPNTMDEVEVCMELSVQGKISLSVNGGPIISF